MFYKLGRAGRAAARSSAPSTSPRPSRRGCATCCSPARSTRRYGVASHKATGPAAPVYDAVVLDAPPTGRITRFLNVNARGRRPGQGRPDPLPGRLDHGAAAVAADRGAPGDPAGGDAGPGDGRRRRRAASGRGCRSAAIVVNAVRDAAARPGRRPTAAGRRPICPRRGRRRPRRRQGPGHRRRGRRRCWPRPRPRRARRPGATRPSAIGRRWAARPTSCRLLPEGVDLGGARTSWPSAAGPGRHGLHGRRRPSTLDARARRPADPHRRVLRRPAGSARRPPRRRSALRAAEQGRPGRRADHRPRPPAGAVDGPDRRWTTPRGRVKDIDASAGGSLDAMMLDMKRTFDEVVLAHADPGARPSRSSPTPSTRRVVQLLRRHAGVHGDGEARASSGRGRPRPGTAGTSSSSTPRRPGRRWTSWTRPSGSGPSWTAASSGLLAAPARAGGRAYLKVFSAGVRAWSPRR